MPVTTQRNEIQRLSTIVPVLTAQGCPVLTAHDNKFLADAQFADILAWVTGKCLGLGGQNSLK